MFPNEAEGLGSNDVVGFLLVGFDGKDFCILFQCDFLFEKIDSGSFVAQPLVSKNNCGEVQWCDMKVDSSLVSLDFVWYLLNFL